MERRLVEPDDEGGAFYERAELQEAYRRLKWVIHTHPYLSGLMEREFTSHLNRLWDITDIARPEGEPDMEAEIGYSALTLETYEDETETTI